MSKGIWVFFYHIGKFFPITFLYDKNAPRESACGLFVQKQPSLNEESLSLSESGLKGRAVRGIKKWGSACANDTKKKEASDIWRLNLI